MLETCGIRLSCNIEEADEVEHRQLPCHQNEKWVAPKNASFSVRIRTEFNPISVYTACDADQIFQSILRIRIRISTLLILNIYCSG